MNVKIQITPKSGGRYLAEAFVIDSINTNRTTFLCEFLMDSKEEAKSAIDKEVKHLLSKREEYTLEVPSSIE